MKYFFSFFLLSFFSFAHAQQMVIEVSAQNKYLNLNLDEDNLNKTLYISAGKIATKNGYLSAKVFNEEVDTSWGRFFMLYDTANTEIAKLRAADNNNEYWIELTSLLPLMKPNENYFLYTTAYPKDPHKAMLVKVPRRFVCVVKLVK